MVNAGNLPFVQEKIEMSGDVTVDGPRAILCLCFIELSYKRRPLN
jgi:hypothetical protein